MKKQTALLLSTLVLMSAVSVQPAHAFKFFNKKAKPAVTAPVKAPEVVVKKEVPAAPVATVKPVVKPAPVAAVKVVPAAKPAVKAAPAKPAVKAPVKK